MIARVLLAALWVLAGAAAAAQSVYVYEDDQGQKHFSDRPPPDGRKAEVSRLVSLNLDPEVKIVERRTDEGVTLVAINEFHCPVELQLELVHRRNMAGDDEAAVVVPAAGEIDVLSLRPADASMPARYRYEYRYMLGDPEARHDDQFVYRVPYAKGRAYTVSQAYPLALTHTGAGRQHAIDFALPEGTPVHAARGGTVVAIAYRSFSGGTDAKDADKANLVQILHDDGTLAIYAHLSLNSVRVRPGDAVVAGQYIANSGNTGFSSGPHLHFAVERNTGMASKTVPVRFAGERGRPAVAQTGQPLRSY